MANSLEGIRISDCSRGLPTNSLALSSVSHSGRQMTILHGTLDTEQWVIPLKICTNN